MWGLLKGFRLTVSAYDRDFVSLLDADTGKRRRLVQAVLPLVTDPSKEVGRLAQSDPPVVRGEDIPWLIELLEQTCSEQVLATCVELIGSVFFFEDTDAYLALVS